MKLTNQEIVRSIPSLNALVSLKLPVKTSFKLAKGIKKLDEVLSVYNETLKKLQIEHAAKDDEGQPKTENGAYVFKDPEAFNKATNELLEVENQVDIDQFKLEHLGDISLEPSVMLNIMWLMKD